jgi:Uma2 family endonuclease
MVLQIQPSTQPDVFYPDTDDQPMAENTIQFRWLVKIQENLNSLFINDPNVFVAGDLFWYPVEGNNKIVYAPDVMVVIGRPKGDRMSYMQWREANIPPSVVFEILSPSNTKAQMKQKFLFYQRYGVGEYYIYDPETNYLEGWLRNQDTLNIIPEVEDWVSPRLKIRFVVESESLALYHPNGEAFTTYDQAIQQRNQAEQAKIEAEQARDQAEQAKIEAEQARDQAEQAKIEAEQARDQAAHRLLAMGLSVDQVAEALGFSGSQVQEIAEKISGQ